MVPAHGGVSLNVENLAGGAAGGGASAGFTCIHSRHAANEMMVMRTPTSASTPHTNHSDQRLFSPNLRLF